MNSSTQLGKLSENKEALPDANGSGDPFKSHMTPRDDFIVVVLLGIAWPFALSFNTLVLVVGIRFRNSFKAMHFMILHLAALDMGM